MTATVLDREPLDHEALPKRATIRTCDNVSLIAGAIQPWDFPATAACDSCGQRIKKTDSLGDWAHV